MGSLVSKTNSGRLAGALVFASVAAIMAASVGCKKKQDDGASGTAPAGSYHFAFVTTNNLHGLLEHRREGSAKRRKGLWREGGHVPPAQG